MKDEINGLDIAMDIYRTAFTHGANTVKSTFLLGMIIGVGLGAIGITALDMFTDRNPLFNVNDEEET